MADFDKALWIKRIDRDEAFQAERHDAWKTSRSLYDMTFWRARGFSPSMVNETITPVNYIPTFVSTKVSMLYSRNPKIFVRSRRPRYAPFAQTMEDLLERYWDEQHLKEVLLEIIRDTIIFGIGWAECGYFKTADTLPERVVGDQEQPEDAVKSQVDEFLNAVTGRTPKEEALPSEEGVLHEQQQPGQFYCLRRSPYDVLWPAGFHSYASLPYIILRDRMRMEDFLQHPGYSHKESVSPTRLPENKPNRLQKVVYDIKQTFRGSPQVDSQVIDLYHIWDRRSMEVTTISKKGSDPHAGPDDWPYLTESFPAIPLMFNSLPDHPDHANAYPFSDVEPIIPQVLEKSNIRTAMVQHRKRANAVVFVQKGGTTESEVTNYARASDAVDVVPVSNIAAIQMGPQISIPPAIFQTEQAINADLDRDSGLQLMLAELNRAAQIDKATVANIAQGNVAVKTGYGVDRVESFSKQIATMTVGLMWQYLTPKEVGEKLGMMPDAEAWPPLPTDLTLARQRVRYELELRIEAGSTRPIQDDVLDREQFLRYIRIFQAVSPGKFAQVENEVLALMAKKFREPALEQMILSAINTNHAQVAQQENQLLMQGFPQIVREEDDHTAHIPVHAQAATSPMHKLQADSMAQQGKQHPLDQHLLTHAQMSKQKQLVNQGHNQQSVKQQTDAPSATEIGRSGSPGFSDLAGQGFNLRQGTGSESGGV